MELTCIVSHIVFTISVDVYIVACFLYIGDDHESNVLSFLKVLKDVLGDDSFKTASPVQAQVAVG